MFNTEDFRELVLVLISTPIYIVFIGLEIFLSNRKKKDFYSLKDSTANVYLMLLNMGLDILMRAFVYFILLFFFTKSVFIESTIIDGSLNRVFTNPILYWFALFILEDFAYYWLHRIDHVTRLFWSVHVTHHSSSKFNLTTGFRSSVFQPLYRFAYFIPIAWLGFHPLDILFMYAVTQIYGILVHTQFVDKMGILEHILVTPSHHRVHHASNIPFLDKNMGMTLIIWDKLFGTFVPEADDAYPDYGLVKDFETFNPFKIFIHEYWGILKDVFGRSRSMKSRLLYVLAPPGWSHDGSRQTSDDIKREYYHNLAQARARNAQPAE